jgi:serine/threonine protein kinase
MPQSDGNVGDRTIVYGHMPEPDQMMPEPDAMMPEPDAMMADQPMMADPQGAGDTTLRPDAAIETPAPRPAGEYFLLKGEDYLKKSCLSDNSGEAQVFLVEFEGKEYVLKVYYPNFDINKKLLQVIHSFEFEMIVRVIDYGKTYVDGKHRYYELMEYLRGGTLQEYKLNGNMDQFRRIALQGAAALAYCHQNNILHKDIKPGNFFFRDPAHQQLVLGDFGISSMLESDGKTYRTTQARTPIYAAPEMYADVIDGEVEITPAADFYSLGMTLFAVWLGENPMSSNERVMMKQKNEGRLPRLDELPDRVRMIVMGLTAVNPTSRWKYDQVERWFLGEDVHVDVSSPFLRYKVFVVDPDRNIVAENVHELVPLLVENDRLAMGYLYDGRIVTWLESCGNTKLATAVKDIVTNRYPVDKKAGLMAAVYTMEPTYPYRDVQGVICDDIHNIAVSLLSNQDRYAIELRNPNNPLFLWLESHTKCDLKRLRSYFTPEADGRVSLLRLVYEMDPDIPFLTHYPSSTIKEIVYAFGNANLGEDDWHALVDGRLLSWMYAREDVMACEALRILTKDQPYSKSLAYKVLYNLDRDAAYDLSEAHSPSDIGRLLANRLKHLEHLSAEDFAKEMEDFTDPNGRYHYYAELHGWHQLIDDANHCFDMTLPENRDRLSAYDLRTAVYRYCCILGVTPTYLLPNGVELQDGHHIDQRHVSTIKNELRNGSFAQWLSIFYHEDPQKGFEQEYSYERELENWVMELGRYDNQQAYYRRFIKAREDTTKRVSSVRREWKQARMKGRFWRFTFYGLSAVWMALVVIFGITGHDYLLYEHPMFALVAPLGGMLGVIVAVRAFFRGFGFLMSLLWGSIGVASSFIPLYALRYVDGHYPDYFNWAVVALTLIFMLIIHFTDFRSETQTDNHEIGDILNGEDVQSTLLDPLYYTFKTKSLRYKSSKFGVLDDISDQVRGGTGETSIHYALSCVMMVMLIGLFCVYSPRLLDKRLPDSQDKSKLMEQIDNNINELDEYGNPVMKDQPEEASKNDSKNSSKKGSKKSSKKK